jgi:hypothetical protein
MQSGDLDKLSRSQLIERAEAVGAANANVLTRAELVDEIIRRSVPDPIERRIARGLIGMARDLVARVVERGLHLPDAAARIRKARLPEPWQPSRTPIATVTLAEIYAAQGHKVRALQVLDEVLAREPDHGAARALRDRIAGVDVEPAMPPEPEDEPAAAPEDEPSAHGVSLLPVVADTCSSNAIAIVPRSGRSACVYWELLAATVAAEEAEAPEGEIVVRVLAVTPTWAAPLVEVREVEASERCAGAVLSELPARAILRAVVGWKAGDSFQPLAVTLDAAAFAPEASRPDPEVAGRGRTWDARAGATPSPWGGLAIVQL